MSGVVNEANDEKISKACASNCRRKLKFDPPRQAANKKMKLKDH